MEFRGAPSFAQTLWDTGFTVMNVANNHTGEHGLAAMQDTFRNLEKAGLSIVGLRDQDRISKPLVQIVKGLRIGWLSYTWILSKHLQQDLKELAYPRRFDMAKEVREFRGQVDFLIVSAHWGKEYLLVPPRRVVEEAHAMAEAGADLILGHHPHVLQGVEWHEGCYIVYSLGNFLFDDWQRRLRETAVFQCAIVSGKVTEPKFIPVAINRHFQPEPAGSEESARILRRIEKSSARIHDYAVHSPCDSDALKQEREVKRRMVFENMLFLLLNLRKMGPRTAYQKLRHRVTFLPSLV
jgi:poly-gamma-glutamate synthesis protein (capsule biosynthesis protein)